MGTIDLVGTRARPPAEQPSDARIWWPGRVRPALSAFLCLGLLAAGLWALKASPESRIGPYGLIQALSHWYYAIIVVLLLSLVWTLGAERYRTPLLSAHLIVLVILVHGAPAVIESEPRFATAWLHAGFTNYVAGTGKFLPQVDARFSWPSFFAGSALLDKAAGLSTAVSLIRWWPVALNLLYLPLIFRIANEFLRSDEKAWIATALFPLANWVGQDYYSPQSIAFLLYLTFIYILIGPLGVDGLPLWHSYWRLRGQSRILRTGRPWIHGAARPYRQNGERPPASGFYLGVSVLLMAAMATGHQLTPIVATGSALMLMLTGKTRVRWLVAVFGLMTAGWVCYGAATFWSGHIGLLVGGIGSVQSNVAQSVIARLQGSPAHQFVVDFRLFTSLIVWLLALAGAFVWRSGNAGRVALVGSFIVPFTMLAGGSYGGEAILRVYLFSLPFAICLIAALVSQLRGPYRQLAAVCVLVLLTPLFLVSRWGNELFELVRPNEVTAVQELYHIAAPGSTLIAMSPELPWRFTDVGEFRYQADNIAQFSLYSTPAVMRLVEGNPNGGYVIITTSQIVFGWQTYDFPPTWGQTIEKLLSGSPYFKLVYSNPDAEIFKYIPRPRSR